MPTRCIKAAREAPSGSRNEWVLRDRQMVALPNGDSARRPRPFEFTRHDAGYSDFQRLRS